MQHLLKTVCLKIKEYVDKGHARIMSEDEAESQSSRTFYLPHFGVINLNKKKLRFFLALLQKQMAFP